MAPATPDPNPTSAASADSNHGYPKLAELMSLCPETAVFRRFSTVSMLNVLRLQAELQYMEKELDVILLEDAHSTDAETQSYSTDFALMRDKVEQKLDPEQLEQITEIGKKLEEYKSAIDTAMQLDRIGRPTKDELQFVRHWLDRPDGGASFLKDREAKIWDEDDEDYMSLYNRPFPSDSFTRLLTGPLLSVYHGFWGQRKKGVQGYRMYSNKRVTQTSRIVGVVLSSALPTITVLVLYFVTPPLIRIGLVIVFTALFSLALSIFTSANPAEIFTATATFAAVEVVFIGTTG